jgi:hypothetical protein
MQTLKLADDLMPLARDGYKRVTVRNGERDIVPGPMVFEATDGTEDDVHVNVLQSQVVLLRHTPQWALDGENLGTSDELWTVLERFYPQVTLDSKITCIEFEAVT